MYIRQVLVLFTIAVVLAFGQASPGFADETMTNAVVVEMFEAGLSAEVIIAQIEQGSNTNFDLEASSLIALSKLGIPSEVIAAMQRATQRSNPPGVSPLPQRPSRQPGTAHRGVTLIAEGERHFMYAAKMAGVKWVPFVPFKIMISGSHARLRVKDNTPVFEISITTNSHPEDAIMLVKVKAKKDIRLITAAEIPLGFDPIPAASASGSYTQTFRAVVEKPLESGEYVIVVGSHRYFDFGIDL